VAEKFVALTIDEDGTALVHTCNPTAKKATLGFFNSDGAQYIGDHFSSFERGSFVPNKDGIIDNWRDSLVFRPGYELVNGGMAKNERLV
jgi:hypothetical protein